MHTATLVLGLAFLAPAALSAQQVIAELEPNDAPATAQPILSGQQITASFSSTTDEDWFSFTMTATGQAHLRTLNSGTLTLSSTRDTRIALYDATGTTRLAWNDGASGTRADCGVTLPAGQYLYRVGLKTTITAPVAYDLDFFVMPSRVINTVEGPEPNDPTVPLGVPTPMSLADTIEGSLSSPTDVDFWSFQVSSPGVVQAASFDDGGVPQLDNLALRYYQETAPGVWEALGAGNATNSASHRVSSLQHAGLLQPGNYAIAVQAGTVAAGVAPWDYVKTGQYSLRTSFIPMQGATQLPEAPEPNSTPATASFAIIGEDVIGTAQAGNDPDWYALTISVPVTIAAMAEGIGATPLPGSTLRIWDANGNTYGSGSGSATTHGRIVTTLVVPGTYYLEIAASQFAMSGDYLLHIGGALPFYLQSATRVEPASTNACIGSNDTRPLLGYLPGESAVFNSTFVTRIERTVGPTFVIVAFGFSNTTASGGTVPLPVLLGFGGLDSLGAPTPCYLRVDPEVLLLTVTDAAGSADLALTFPFSLAQNGAKIYQQAICFDPTLNPLGLSVSNDASFVVGDLPF